MFVVIIGFPPVKEGRDAEFTEWFVWSNKELAKQKGFIGRRLLKPVKGGNYVVVIEHESEKTFMAIQKTLFHDEAAKRVGGLLEGHPMPQFYEVIIK